MALSVVPPSISDPVRVAGLSRRPARPARAAFFVSFASSSAAPSGRLGQPCARGPAGGRSLVWRVELPETRASSGGAAVG